MQDNVFRVLLVGGTGVIGSQIASALLSLALENDDEFDAAEDDEESIQMPKKRLKRRIIFLPQQKQQQQEQPHQSQQQEGFFSARFVGLDYRDKDSLDQAMQGVHLVIHSASPFQKQRPLVCYSPFLKKLQNNIEK